MKPEIVNVKACVINSGMRRIVARSLGPRSAADLAHCERNSAEVERYSSDLIELSTRHHFAHFLAVGPVFRGWACSASGDTTEGILLIEQGIRDFRATDCTTLNVAVDGLVSLRVRTEVGTRCNPGRWPSYARAFRLPGCEFGRIRTRDDDRKNGSPASYSGIFHPLVGLIFWRRK